MSNDITYNPIVVDTAGSDTIWGNFIVVKSIRWVGATVAGDKAEIQAPSGKVLWSSEAGGANNVEKDLIERIWQDGFKVPTLDSGKLYIEYL